MHGTARRPVRPFRHFDRRGCRTDSCDLRQERRATLPGAARPVAEGLLARRQAARAQGFALRLTDRSPLRVPGVTVQPGFSVSFQPRPASAG